MRKCFSALVCAALANALPASAQTWDIKRPVTAGAPTVSGFVPAKTMSITVEITAPGDTLTANRRVVDRQVLTPNPAGAFEMKGQCRSRRVSGPLDR